MGVRELNRLRRIDDIIETAANIFVRDGYALFSARRVANELGISLSSLQHYCGTTDKLLLSMLQVKIESFITRFAAVATNRELSAQDRLIAVIDEDMAATRDPWIASFSFQAWALADHDIAVRESLRGIYQGFGSILADLIMEMRPSLALETAQVYATLIASQIEGLLFYYNRASSDTVNPDYVIATMKSFWLKTILE